ncbi:MAG TPA: endonuclease/exonuclease/phosphatase family protein [Actinomycetota bacterium]|nr:endonuclease/exonuclease/phosphatase family protein [Actinomycetota bacterium]
MSFTVGTFNVENLFARFRFKDGVDPSSATIDGWTAEMTLFDIFNETAKRITAKTILAAEADVLALQEVENLDTLKRFRNVFLEGTRRHYPYALAIDGNDPRMIDVALLSRFPIVRARSYQDLRVADSNSYVFSRDCLEVDVETDVGEITLFVNHFKSMMGGRANTRARRVLQAHAVREIVEARFGADAGGHPFVVLGDLNDYPEADEGTTSGITEISEWDQVENVLDRLPEEERWTHYYNRGNEYRQLDYLLVSKALADNNREPTVVRVGLPWRAARYEGERIDGVGEDDPKASDHCPLLMELG